MSKFAPPTDIVPGSTKRERRAAALQQWFDARPSGPNGGRFMLASTFRALPYDEKEKLPYVIFINDHDGITKLRIYGKDRARFIHLGKVFELNYAATMHLVTKSGVLNKTENVTKL